VGIARLPHTAPQSTAGMQQPDPAAPEPSPDPPVEVVRAAFRELHGRRLHGFALLLMLGDRERAGSLTSDALAAGQLRVDELQHPERAAAWLRRRVVRRAGSVQRARSARDDRLLAQLGADGPVVSALATLGRLERAALIAATIERLDRRDVSTIVGRSGAALDRVLRRARSRWVEAHGVNLRQAQLAGPIVARVLDVARRALA
jgi:DNA-directed RNA polymerase specialized sigma24 family protein